ncbi:YciI family protein [Corynebacterium sp. MSK044]|uniref:YciI family protein n=1 Tax=unclassified Corynebacterium TaxID=2624378 RepID=UPI00254EA7BE|nr:MULTISPECIES: YciI family protein [unclassified Corynebacterium]MDK8794474.1 YciI family protein [Corynebacterium sp. MSK041]MDK8797306.1 YciI family protein [Corynebacterium sp. MSK044]
MTHFIVTYTYGEHSLIHETRPAHRSFIARLKDQGYVIAAGPYGDGNQSVIILRMRDGSSLGAAAELLAEDPYLTAGALADRDFREWSPVINVWE